MLIVELEIHTPNTPQPIRGNFPKSAHYLEYFWKKLASHVHCPWSRLNNLTHNVLAVWLEKRGKRRKNKLFPFFMGLILTLSLENCSKIWDAIYGRCFFLYLKCSRCNKKTDGIFSKCHLTFILTGRFGYYLPLWYVNSGGLLK